MPYYQPMMVPPPPVVSPPAVAALPTWQPAPYLANSTPIGSMFDLPRPEQLAPELYMGPHTHGAGYANPMAVNTYNNFNMPPNGAPQMPYNPAGQPLGQQPPVAEPAKSPEPAKPAEAPVAPPKVLPQLTSAAVQELNDDLQSQDSDTRMRAANRLSKILEGDPAILTNPATKDYAEALILKVLGDSTSLVRQPILLALEVGWVNNPTPKIMNALQALKGEQGLYNFEPGIIDKVMGGLRAKWNATQQAFAGTPAATNANPAAAELGTPQAAAPVPATSIAPGTGVSPAAKTLAAQAAYAPQGTANLAPTPIGGAAHV